MGDARKGPVGGGLLLIGSERVGGRRLRGG